MISECPNLRYSSTSFFWRKVKTNTDTFAVYELSGSPLASTFVKAHVLIARLTVGAKPFVERLCARVSPSAIGWFIITVNINSIYRMLAGWAQAHVSHKIVEVIPPDTNTNTSSTIKVVIRAIRVVATISHTRPCPILNRKTFCVPGVSNMVNVTVPGKTSSVHTAHSEPFMAFFTTNNSACSHVKEYTWQ